MFTKKIILISRNLLYSSQLKKVLKFCPVSANTISIVGGIGQITAGLLFISHPVLAGSLILFKLISDGLDGAVASAKNEQSVFGEYIDGLISDDLFSCLFYYVALVSVSITHLEPFKIVIIISSGLLGLYYHLSQHYFAAKYGEKVTLSKVKAENVWENIFFVSFSGKHLLHAFILLIDPKYFYVVEIFCIQGMLLSTLKYHKMIIKVLRPPH